MKTGFPKVSRKLVDRGIVAALVLSLTVTVAQAGSDHDHDRGRQLFHFCAVCHGPQGHGNRQLLAPAIAGLPEWYLVNQLKKFRNGGRGAHPDDVAGLKMRPMARTLDIGSLKQDPATRNWDYKSDTDLIAVAHHVSELDPNQPVDDPELKGDAERGKTLYMNCMACHSTPELRKAMKAPPQANLEDWYMLEQLKKFKQGQRGANTKDIEGMTMAPIVKATIPDEQAMKDVITYIRIFESGAAEKGKAADANSP